MSKQNIVKFTLICIVILVAIVIAGFATIAILRSVYPDSSNVEVSKSSLTKEEADSTYKSAGEKLKNGDLDEASELYTKAGEFYKSNPDTDSNTGKGAEIDAQLSLIEAQKKAKEDIKASQRQQQSNDNIPGIVAQ